MIRSVRVVPHFALDAWPRAAEAALISIAAPGCEPQLPEQIWRVLRLRFDGVPGELEAAALRVIGSAPATPFCASHARRIGVFLAFAREALEPLDLLLTESDGLQRSATLARWIGEREGLPVREPVWGRAIRSCPLMQQVLHLHADSATASSLGWSTRGTLPTAPALRPLAMQSPASLRV